MSNRNMEFRAGGCLGGYTRSFSHLAGKMGDGDAAGTCVHSMPVLAAVTTDPTLYIPGGGWQQNADLLAGHLSNYIEQTKQHDRISADAAVEKFLGRAGLADKVTPPVWASLSPMAQCAFISNVAHAMLSQAQNPAAQAGVINEWLAEKHLAQVTGHQTLAAIAADHGDVAAVHSAGPDQFSLQDALNFAGNALQHLEQPQPQASSQPQFQGQQQQFQPQYQQQQQPEYQQQQFQPQYQQQQQPQYQQQQQPQYQQPQYQQQPQNQQQQQPQFQQQQPQYGQQQGRGQSLAQGITPAVKQQYSEQISQAFKDFGKEALQSTLNAGKDAALQGLESKILPSLLGGLMK